MQKGPAKAGPFQVSDGAAGGNRTHDLSLTKENTDMALSGSLLGFAGVWLSPVPGFSPYLAD